MNKNILADEIRVLGEGKNIECLEKRMERYSLPLGFPWQVIR